MATVVVPQKPHRIATDHPDTTPPLPPTDVKTGPVYRELELKGQVGFSSLPEQMVQKSIQHGFTFNLLCVGESGIGKTTLMQSLFNMELHNLVPCSRELDTVELISETLNITESNVHADLTIVETAGFEHNRAKSTQDIVSYIQTQFGNYLREELKRDRRMNSVKDTRIHACLYFISANSISLGFTTAEISCLRALSNVVNVILIIAKADIISRDDLRAFKTSIMERLTKEKIKLYKFPTDDPMVSEINQKLNDALPFAVVGSNEFTEHDGRKVRARTFPWGKVLIENEEHSDFVKLREALLRVNIVDLHDTTDEILYESFRRDVLTKRFGSHDLTSREMIEKMRSIQKTRVQQTDASHAASIQKLTQEIESLDNKMHKLREEQIEFEGIKKRHLEELEASSVKFEKEREHFQKSKDLFLAKKTKK